MTYINILMLHIFPIRPHFFPLNFHPMRPRISEFGTLAKIETGHLDIPLDK